MTAAGSALRSYVNALIVILLRAVVQFCLSAQVFQPGRDRHGPGRQDLIVALRIAQAHGVQHRFAPQGEKTRREVETVVTLLPCQALEKIRHD